MGALDQLRQIADRMRDPTGRPRVEARQDIARLTGPEQVWLDACTEASGKGLVDDLDPLRDGPFAACIPMMREESPVQAQVSTSVLLAAYTAALIRSGQWDERPLSSRIGWLLGATSLWDQARTALAGRTCTTPWPVAIVPIAHQERIDQAAARFRIVHDATGDAMAQSALENITRPAHESTAPSALLSAVRAATGWPVGPIDMLVSAFTDPACLDSNLRRTDLRLLVDCGPEGMVLLLQLLLVPWGRDEFFPDPLAMTYFSCDTQFASALQTAWDNVLGWRRRSTEGLSSVAWRLRVFKEGDQLSPYADHVGGASAGAGMAVGLRFLLSARRRDLTPQETWAITGRLEPSGAIRDVGGLENKLNAAFSRGLNVVVPAELADRLRSEYPGRKSSIHGAETVAEATDLMRGAVGREVADFVGYAWACVRRWAGREAKEAAQEVVSPDALVEGDVAQPPAMTVRKSRLDVPALSVLFVGLVLDVWLAVAWKGGYGVLATAAFFLAAVALHRSRLRWPAVSRTVIDVGLDRMRGKLDDRLLGEHVFTVIEPGTHREYKVILAASAQPLPIATEQRVHIWGSRRPLTRRIRSWKVEWIGAGAELGVACGPKLVPVWDALMVISLVILVAKIVASVYGMMGRV